MGTFSESVNGENPRPSLVMFKTNACRACAALAMPWARLAGRWAGVATFHFVDCDEAAQLCFQEIGTQSVFPRIVLYHPGDSVLANRQDYPGAASEAGIEAFLMSVLAADPFLIESAISAKENLLALARETKPGVVLAVAAPEGLASQGQLRALARALGDAGVVFHTHEAG